MGLDPFHTAESKLSLLELISSERPKPGSPFPAESHTKATILVDLYEDALNWARRGAPAIRGELELARRKAR